MVTTTSGAISLMMPKYWDDLLLDNLYPQLYFYQFGEKRRVPQGSGKTFYIPRWKKVATARGLTDGTPTYTCSMSAQFLSGTLTAFGDAYKHSDFVVMTALSSVIEGSLREISKGIAKQIDDHIKFRISSAGTIRNAAGGAATATGDTTALVIKDVIHGATTLENNDAFKFPDGMFAGILHPKQVYDLKTQASASQGNWVDIHKYTSAVENIYRGEVGRLFGVRFVATSNVRVLSLADSALSAGKATGYQGLILSPGAYHVVELDGAMAQTYIKGLGSAGTADAINQVATVGAKVYFEVVAQTSVHGTANDVRQIQLNTGTGF